MWRTVKLGDELSIARGGSPRPIKSFITDEDDGINWIKIGDTTQGGRYIESTKEKIKPSGVSRSRYVKSGDFLLSNSMSFGRPYILKTDGCIHDGWLVLSDYEETFTADYLYYLLSSTLVQNQFEKLARGSTVRNLNTELVSSVVVNVPPLAEQQRIVAKLDAAFAEIDRAIEITTLKLIHANQLFPNALESIFNSFRKSSECAQLGEVCEKIQDGAHHSPKTLHDVSGVGRFPYITSKNIRTNYMTLDNVQYVEKDFHETIYPRCNARFGDVLLTKDGASTGNICLNELDEPISLLSSVCLIRGHHDKLLNEFICFYLQSPTGFQTVTGSMTGAAIKRIILRRIKTTEIPLPSTQQQAEACEELQGILEKTTHIVKAFQTQIGEYNRLKSAILAQELQPAQSEAA